MSLKYSFFLWLIPVALLTLPGCDSLEGANSIHHLENGTVQKDTAKNNIYSWLSSYRAEDMLVNRIPVPEGFKRVSAHKNSFADWLRHLPLKTGDPVVKLYNGELKRNQSAQYAVVDIDVGNEDLQQCADAVMRLKAEYHFSRREKEKIHFEFTSGDNADYSLWIEGYRPVLNGNKVNWVKKAQKDTSYKGFKAYLKQVFTYAGTSSLSKEMLPVSIKEIKPGDVFIKGGFPGHAVIVLDMAADEKSGEKIFLLAQSYMPAQDIHILKNPEIRGSPWYPLKMEGILETPEWSFELTELKRFK